MFKRIRNAGVLADHCLSRSIRNTGQGVRQRVTGLHSEERNRVTVSRMCVAESLPNTL